MKPPPFAYHRPQGVPDALAILGRFGSEARLLAGGQSLGPMLNLRLARPSDVIDINDLVELDFVRIAGDALEIGSLTRHHRLASDPQVAAACPILAAAAATIGHYAIRQRGTLGGSLSHADPAAQLPLVATLLDARIVAESSSGRRVLDPAAFFVSSLVTALRPDEMITAVRFPMLPPSCGWAFEMFSQRHGDFAIVSVAAVLTLSTEGAVDRLSLAMGGVGTVPTALGDVARRFVGKHPDITWREGLGQAVAEAITPEDDRRLPAAYRRELANALTSRALTRAVEHARKKLADE